MNSASQALVNEFATAHNLERSIVEQFAAALLAASQQPDQPARKGKKVNKAKAASSRSSPAKASEKRSAKPQAKPQVEPQSVSPGLKLNRDQLKIAIFEYFKVQNGTELRKSPHFKSMVKPLGTLNLSKVEDLEKIYRAYLGVLPNETQDTGYGCINGIDIFKYADVWTIFGLEAKTATKASIQKAYRALSKQYHPDMPNGDRQIFERLTKLYEAALLGV